MDIFKSIIDLGLAGAALAAMIVIIFKLLELFKSMNEVISKNTESLTANTSMTLELKERIERSNEIQSKLSDNVSANTMATRQMVAHFKQNP